MKQYIALIRKEKGSCYGVDFPDFPGCITAADTLEEAQAMAVEVLAFHTEDMAEEGLPFPEPRSIDVILKAPQNKESLVVALLVPVEEKKSQKVRVDFTISESIKNQVDRYVKGAKGVTRSAFFEAAALERLQRVTASTSTIIKAGTRKAKKRVRKRA